MNRIVYLSSFFLLIGFCPLSAQELVMEQYAPDVNCSCEAEEPVKDSNITFTPGKKILETGYKIAYLDKEVIKGSCWDFVNQVYIRAGFSNSKQVVFRSKKGGPYAPKDLVQPGDWVYHINHQFNNIEHSAIFVCWKDFKKQIAITLSYSGRNKNLTGRYGEYKLSSIYSIMRPSSL